MTNYDFSPLFRSSIGFDRLARMMDATTKAGAAMGTYPPYNIVAVGDDRYRITIAVAGFSEGDLEIEVREQNLKVTGKRPEQDGDVRYLHQGIGAGNFVREFQLADHVKVTDASLSNGLLVIDLKQEIPETMKPRTIQIESGTPKSLSARDRKTVEGVVGEKAA
ncbi:MAG: Hsp20 family protein [Alphaproteobacteria bacterium]